MVELKAEKVMELWVECPDSDRLVVGENDFGLLRAICITGGTVSGEVNGRVVPGGADWNKGFGGSKPEEFTSVDLLAKYLLQTDDGIYIAIENTAKVDKTKPDPEIKCAPKFFAPRGKYEWLNYGVYVGSLKGAVKNGVRGVDIIVYKMY